MTDTHALNKLLADVAGVEVKEVWDHVNEKYYWAKVYRSYYQDLVVDKDDIWNPILDPRDMELVKAGLRREGYEYLIAYDWFKKLHEVELTTPYKGSFRDMREFDASHESEAMALAMAIQAMTEATK